MLVVTRETGESIMVGDEIEVVVKEVIGGRVRIGISAPGSFVIKRKEIYKVRIVKDEPRLNAL